MSRVQILVRLLFKSTTSDGAVDILLRWRVNVLKKVEKFLLAVLLTSNSVYLSTDWWVILSTLYLGYPQSPMFKTVRHSVWKRQSLMAIHYKRKQRTWFVLRKFKVKRYRLHYNKLHRFILYKLSNLENIRLSLYKVSLSSLYSFVTRAKKLHAVVEVRLLLEYILCWQRYRNRYTYRALDYLREWHEHRYYSLLSSQRGLSRIGLRTSVSSVYNKLKNLNFFNMQYLKKNLETYKVTKWTNYMDTTVVNKLIGLYYNFSGYKERRQLERNVALDAQFYVSPFYNINLESFFPSKSDTGPLNRVRVSSILSQKVNILNMMRRYITFNYIVPYIYNMFIAPASTIMYKNRYHFYSDVYLNYLCFAVKSMKRVITFYDVHTLRDIRNKVALHVPFAYINNLGTRVVNLFGKGELRNTYIGTYSLDHWLSFKDVFVQNKKVVSTLSRRNNYTNPQLTEAILIENKVNSFDYSKHIDLKYISLLEEHAMNNIRNRHNKLFNRRNLAPETYEAGVHFYTPKKLRYEEVCDTFTLHKTGLEDGYHSYIFSTIVHKLHLIIVRNQWYIYIKDFLVSYYELMKGSSTKPLDSSLQRKRRRLFMVKTMPERRERVRLARLRELAMLEKSAFTSFSMVEWYVYIYFYTRYRFNRFATLERAYAALYKRYYYINRYKIMSSLSKRLTLKNKKLRSLINTKLRSDIYILFPVLKDLLSARSAKAKTKLKAKAKTKLKANKSKKDPVPVPVPVSNRQLRSIKARWIKWLRKCKFGMKYGKYGIRRRIRMIIRRYRAIYLDIFKKKLSFLRRDIIKNNLVEKLLAEKRVPGVYAKSLQLDKVFSKPLWLLTSERVKFLSKLIYNTFYFYRERYANAESNMARYLSNIIKRIKGSYTASLVSEPAVNTFFSKMLHLWKRIKVNRYSQCMRYSLGAHRKDKVVNKVRSSPREKFTYKDKASTDIYFKDSGFTIFQHQRHVILNYMAYFIKQCCFAYYTIDQFSVFKEYIFIFNLREPIMFTSNNIFNYIFMEWFYNINMRDFY